MLARTSRGRPLLALNHRAARAALQIQSQAAGGDNRLQGYVNLLLLKINEKMGGVNWVADRDELQLLRAAPTLVVGLDVQCVPAATPPSFMLVTQ